MRTGRHQALGIYTNYAAGVIGIHFKLSDSDQMG
jgi:hypothetical protein